MCAKGRPSLYAAAGLSERGGGAGPYFPVRRAASVQPMGGARRTEHKSERSSRLELKLEAALLLYHFRCDACGGDVPAVQLNRGCVGASVRKLRCEIGGLARRQLDPVVGPEHGCDEAARGSARRGTNLKRKRAGWVLEVKANLAPLDL